MSPRGYWERNFLWECALGLDFTRGCDECGEMSLDGVFALWVELHWDCCPSSCAGRAGDLDMRECSETCDAARDEGKDESEVRLFAALPWELVVPFVGGR